MNSALPSKTSDRNGDRMPRFTKRVLIVDDHPLVREGIALTIAKSGGMLEVCGQAADLAEAMRLVHETSPHLVLVDISLKNGHGLELCADIKATHEHVKLLVVSAQDEELYAERALHAGASGYLSKEEAGQRLLAAIDRVLEGELYFSPRITQRILQRCQGSLDGPPPTPVQTLSDRELEVFELIGNGMSTVEIANRLLLSRKTIESYRENIKHKLRLENANQLVRHAVQFVLENAAGSGVRVATPAPQASS